MAFYQDIADVLRILHVVEQRRTNADLVEERAHPFHVTAQHVHLLAVNDERGLDDELAIAFTSQLQHCVQRTLLLDATLGQPLHHDTRCVGLGKVVLRECRAYLLVDGVDGLLACRVVRRTEVNHQQRSVLCPAGCRTQEH